MNKKIIAAAVAASIFAPVAMADVTVYGHVRQSLEMNDIGNADTWDMVDRNSRLGFKGSEDLGNGLKAIYQMEFNVRASNGNPNDGNSDIRANRNTFVGLAGDFGTVLAGRHDAPTDLAWKANNIFNDTPADLKAGGGPTATAPFDWTRVDGTVAYVSPSFSGLTVAAAIAPDANQNGANQDGIAEHVSAAVMYNNAGLKLGLGYQDLEVAADSDTAEWNLSARYGMDNWSVGVIYEDAELVGSDIDQETWVINGDFTMGNNVLKAQYWDADQSVPSGSLTSPVDSDAWAIGLQHNFSKRTNASLTYISVDSDAAANDGDVFAIGMNHAF